MAQHVPGSPAASFSVDVLPGAVWTFTPGIRPLLAMAYDASDASSTVMLQPDSLDAFLTASPLNVDYLFMFYASTASTDAAALNDTLYARMEALAFNESRRDAWAGMLHLCTTPVASSSQYITTLLANWTSPMETVAVASVAVPRLDSFYAWLPWPTLDVPYSGVVVGGNACGNWSQNVTNAVAFVSVDAAPPAGCTWTDISLSATNANAAGVVIILPLNASYSVMNCEGSDCNAPAAVPLSQVLYADGQSLLAALTAASNVTYVETQVSGWFFGVDGNGALAELGWLKFATLQFMSWAAQWSAIYAPALQANLTRPALVVPVFNDSLMQGQGINVTVTLPPLAELATYQHFELDFALGCPSPYQNSCAIWDRTLELMVCAAAPAPNDALCGLELGRWITSFRRGTGRWITDVTPLLPLLTSSEMTVHVYTDSWAMPWYPSLSFRFRNDTAEEAAARSGMRVELANAQARALVPLFQGGTFDAQYNNRSPISNFSVPAWASRVLLYVVVTGHGSDENGCGEFCVSSHVFTVNGVVYNNTFWGAGSLWGCADTVALGTEPNEHGTWHFGRGGWCDGRNVAPWIVDVTEDMLPVGQMNVISYVGQYQGATPNPTMSPGYIIMQSYLSVWA